MKKISSGQEGNVYLLNKKILKHRKVNTNNKEFRIQQVLHSNFPKHIIRPVDQFRTLNGKPLFLMDFLNAKNFVQFPNISKKICCDVLTILSKIHKKYPNFRHNDLHGRNIMVTCDEKVYITDFGKSYIDLPQMNHLQIYPDYGIVPGNDQRYDYHFFINIVYFLGIPELQKLIEHVMPPEYLGMETPFVKNFRLRYDVKHDKLPSRTELVKIFCG